jgi:superkiller protein 3
MTDNHNEDERVLEELASDLIKTRQWSKARLVIKNLITMNPGNPATHANLGYVYLGLNEFEKAELCFLTALDKGGESIKILLYMARLHNYQGDFLTQLEFATRAVKLDDENPEPLFYIADAHIRLGHVEEAEAALLKITHVHPESVLAHTMLGNIYLSLQRLDDSAKEFQMALMQDRNDASLWANLGHVLSRQNKTQEALDAFQLALQLVPDNEVYAYNVGDIYLALEQPEKALGYLNKAIKLNPEYSIGYYDLGLAFFKLGRYEDCVIASTTAIRNDPDMEWQRTNLGLGATTNKGLAYLNLGKFTEAEQCFRRNLKLMASTNFNLGLTLFEQRRYEESLVNFQRAHEIKPDDPEYLDLIGNAYSELNQLDRALKALNAAIAVDETYALAHYDMGVVLARMKGKKTAAMKSFQRAIMLNVDLYWAYYGIGCLYALQGKKKLALQFLEKAFQKGFRDIVHLEKDDDWKEFRNDSQFRELIRKSQVYR